MILPKTALASGVAHPLRTVSHDVDLRLSEGSHIVHFKNASQYEDLKVLGHYILHHFSVTNNQAYWGFTSLEDKVILGSLQSEHLSDALSAKLLFPILLLHSKSKLKTTFRFRTNENYNVKLISSFKQMFKG